MQHHLHKRTWTASAPLYLMGHKMLSWYPWVPIGGLMGINCAILTYNGTAYFGFTGDVHAAPDLEKLEKFVDESFAELRIGAIASVKPQGEEAPEAECENSVGKSSCGQTAEGAKCRSRTRPGPSADTKRPRI